MSLKNKSWFTGSNLTLLPVQYPRSYTFLILSPFYTRVWHFFHPLAIQVYLDRQEFDARKDGWREWCNSRQKDQLHTFHQFLSGCLSVTWWNRSQLLTWLSVLWMSNWTIPSIFLLDLFYLSFTPFPIYTPIFQQIRLPPHQSPSFVRHSHHESFSAT